MSSHQRSWDARVRVSGKFFRVGEDKWSVKGFTYGPFTPRDDGEFLPPRRRVCDDFAQMQRLGATTLRVYHPPPLWLLDLALQYDLRVLIDVPWEKHRCFFEDWSAQQDARARVRCVARDLGGHPAVFAVSVANEFPSDVVRFYGHARLERFVSELIDVVHQESPDCLATFANYPTTEFLSVSNQDFYCFNVYLHDPERLAGYLHRLQHLAGNLPLVLGEYGIDSIRQGDEGQATMLAEHVEQVFRQGLAGSYVFAYTDDWFTGGHQIEDWAFGVTRRDRSDKPAAARLREVWSRAPHALLAEDLPSTSVVVCSYNGGATLAECLESLMTLNYPDYEVILVDDGSTDDTSDIAADFPQVRTIRQPNRGLSVARNVGAEYARGEIVVYTDSDCVADEDWLLYLVRGMRDQDVPAIGGPNITPPSDNWTARCVAASPGNPSHVMLDDRRAEHVPGCNLGIRRDVLLGLGGFDPQFRQAGDDVDLCWRLLDAGLEIGFAPGAMVWHHRRCTVRAFFKQQKGYGRAESMVRFKHPQRFGSLGHPRFQGVIYGDGAVSLPVLPPRIYYGPFGSAPYQIIYRHNEYGPSAWLTSFEWHAIALWTLLIGLLWPPLMVLGLAMWSVTLTAVGISSGRASLPRGAPLWCRPMILFLHLAQPVLRGWHRYLYRQSRRRLPAQEIDRVGESPPAKRLSLAVRDLYWESESGRGREHLLEALIEQAAADGWTGNFRAEWVPWDAELIGTRWHDVTIRTATEELGWPRRFTRARWTVHLTRFSRFVLAATAVWILLAVTTGAQWAIIAGAAAVVVIALRIAVSHRRCLRAAGRLLWRAAGRARLAPIHPPILEETEPVVMGIPLPVGAEPPAA